VVGDNTNIMKTTFDLNLIRIKLLNSMDTQKHGNKEKLLIKKAFIYSLVNLLSEKSLLKIKALIVGNPAYKTFITG